jgi:hypothetical protein
MSARLNECMHWPVVSLEPALAGWLCDMKDQRELIMDLTKRMERMEAGAGMPILRKDKQAPLRYVGLAMMAQYQLPEEDFFGSSREARLVEARHLAFFLCRVVLGATYKAIGEVFKRDHGTVMYGCASMAERIATDRKMAALAEELAKKVRSVQTANNNNNKTKEQSGDD